MSFCRLTKHVDIDNSTPAVFIPYEVGLHFFTKGLYPAVDNGKLPNSYCYIVFYDFGSFVILPDQISSFLDGLTNLIADLDKILNIISLPKTIGSTDRVIFKDYLVYTDAEETPVDDKGVSFNKEDMLILLEQLKYITIKAKESNVGLSFDGD